MSEVEKKYLPLAQLKIEGERSSLNISFGYCSDDDADREPREAIPLPDRLYAVCDLNARGCYTYHSTLLALQLGSVR